MMNDYPLPFLLLFCFFTLLPCIGAKETITVTATATGETVYEAEINALQNAVRKSLGEFVN